MTAYTPVGINTAISFSGTSAPSVAIPQQTSYLRVTAHTNTCHVKVNNSDATPVANTCLLYTSPSPRDGLLSRMPSSA